MNEKKIYKILKDWFPELSEREIPSKKHLMKFKHFINFLAPTRIGYRYRSFLLKIDSQCFSDNGLEYCALFHDHEIQTDPIQKKIRTQAVPLLEHYEKHKETIGHYYDVYQQIFDLIVQEIFETAQNLGYELLLIYADTYYWMIVPSKEKMIQKFCLNFNAQFKHENISIEHYYASGCLRST